VCCPINVKRNNVFCPALQGNFGYADRELDLSWVDEYRTGSGSDWVL
jgi:hypothetical protein